MQEIARQINGLAETNLGEAETTAVKITDLLAQLDPSGQQQIHSLLSYPALKLIYELREDLHLAGEAREPLIWWYFRTELRRNDNRFDSVLFSMLLEEAAKHYTVALESIIIQALKSDALTSDQVSDAGRVFSSQAFLKESYAYQCRSCISEGDQLQSEQVKRLLELRAYSTLELALDRGGKTLSPDGLALLVAQYRGEADKKIRANLARKVQSLLNL